MCTWGSFKYGGGAFTTIASFKMVLSHHPVGHSDKRAFLSMTSGIKLKFALLRSCGSLCLFTRLSGLNLWILLLLPLPLELSSGWSPVPLASLLFCVFAHLLLNIFKLLGHCAFPRLLPFVWWEQRHDFLLLNTLPLSDHESDLLVGHLTWTSQDITSSRPVPRQGAFLVCFLTL